MRVRLETCQICGALRKVVEAHGDCPQCRTRARTNSLAPVLRWAMGSTFGVDTAERGPALLFAPASAEQKIAEPYFPSMKVATLYGSYGSGTETGVDVCDLSRFADEMFSAHLSILLFDFVIELEQALAEAHRVLRDGGWFMTHIGAQRLVDGELAPTVTKLIEGGTPAASYLPVGATMPDVKVGRETLLQTLRRVGFQACYVAVEDEGTGNTLDWFVGRKPAKRTTLTATSEVRGRERTAPPQFEPMSVGESFSISEPGPARTAGKTMSHTFATPVDPSLGFKRIILNVAVPAFPAATKTARFACHGYDVERRESTNDILAAKPGYIALSEDLGETWSAIKTPETASEPALLGHLLIDGNILLQGMANPDKGFSAPLFLYDRNGRLLARPQANLIPWHGTRSIDERAGTVMFATYPNNSAKYKPDYATRREEVRHLLADPVVWRSRDGGRSWSKVFSVSFEDIRHFHTLAADPFEDGVWYVSSGDRPHECRVWRSRDDGLSWTEITGASDHVRLHRTLTGRKQSIYRHTDLIIAPDQLIWGADDFLGSAKDANDPETPLAERVGSRIFISPRAVDKLHPESVGYVGNHVRTVVDVGPGYVFMTEAKAPQAFPRAQVVFLSKATPHACVELFTVDRHRDSITGFTYSRGSRAAKSGRFFTARARGDMFSEGTEILQWDIEFE